MTNPEIFVRLEQSVKEYQSGGCLLTYRHEKEKGRSKWSSTCGWEIKGWTEPYTKTKGLTRITNVVLHQDREVGVSTGL